MKRLGLIGGMSWESTAEYYRTINQLVSARLGGLHSADMVIVSVDFQAIADAQHAGQWAVAASMLAKAARQLAAAGAEGIVLCTNTMHKVAPALAQATALPLLHIAEPIGRVARRSGYQKLGLLGTRFTMEDGFMHRYLDEHYGVQVVTPAQQADRQMIHDVIYDELCRGVCLAASRLLYLDVMDGLRAAGAEAIILGCTEISLLIQDQDSRAPLLDSTALHALAAVDWALGA